MDIVIGTKTNPIATDEITQQLKRAGFVKRLGRRKKFSQVVQEVE